MSIDLKTILLIIVILCIVGAIIIFGIRIMTTPTQKTNENVSSNNLINEETTPTPRIESKSTNNTTNNTTEGDILSGSSVTFTKEQLTQIYGTGLNINNNNPKKEFDEDYYDYGVSMDGNTKAFYSVPKNWTRNETKAIDPDTGANVICICSKTSELVEEIYQETTYEDILNAFIERERNASSNPDNVQFYTRELINDGGTYTVLIKNDGFAITSYLIYIKDLYEYHLTFTTTVDDYDNLVGTIDNIFSSYKIR